MTGALWLPDIVKKPLPINAARDPIILPVGAVFHVAVFEGKSLYDMYRNRNDGIESTGYIRRDGTIEQYRPVNVECDAQLAGNSWIEGSHRRGLTSWETQGVGPGQWTAEQLASIKRIILFHHTEHGAPLRINPNPESMGFGYHRLFKAWNPNAHSCPGDDRVKQFHNVIVPWMAAGAQEDDMPLTPAEFDKIKGMIEAEGTKTRTMIQNLVGDVVDSDPAAWGDPPANTKVYARTALARILDRLGKEQSQP
jgi:hypothetical protein